MLSGSTAKKGKGPTEHFRKKKADGKQKVTDGKEQEEKMTTDGKATDEKGVPI